MINMLRKSALFLISSLLLAACVPAVGSLQPPVIVYGQDLCDGCGMIIDDARFAAALILENGETRKFDDLAEMFAYAAEHPQEEVKAWFAHDYESEAWVNAVSAFYLVGNGLATPMGSGLIAFETRQSALTYASEGNAEVLSFEQIKSLNQSD